MLKSEIIAHIKNETQLKTAEVEQVISSFLGAVGATLKVGGEIRLLGFGTFGVAESKGRQGRNPRTWRND
jgi:DNA-binding protein HU-beta